MRKKFTIKLIVSIAVVILMILLLRTLNVFNLIQRQVYKQEYSEYVNKYAVANGIDPMWIYAIIKVESNFNTNATTRQQRDNSHIVIGHKLYCAHSNFPKVPMASSIEVFDTRTMQPIESISLGSEIGSCTWAVPGKKCWYVFFAHYDKGEPGKDASWSQLIQFDRQWRRQRGWILPKELIEDIRPNSLSGGVLVGDTFYCTGHDNGKCYLLKLPSQGMTLEWIGTMEVPFDGQAFSRDKEGNLWGIIRKEQVVMKATPIK